MNDKGRHPRDIWKEPPSGSEGDAAKDFERASERQSDAPDETQRDADESRDYEPKHRAPGRAPLIRRRRSRVGDEETVSWETSWTEPPKEPPPARWTDEEESSVNPPPRPIEDVPYLGPRRSEQRKRRARPPAEPPESEPTPRSREYTGRHLAPKKPRWSRGAEEADRDELEGSSGRDDTFVEGDVERPADDVDAAAAAAAAAEPGRHPERQDESQAQPAVAAVTPPVVDKPAAPATEEPAIEETAIEEPATEEPATDAVSEIAEPEPVAPVAAAEARAPAPPPRVPPRREVSADEEASPASDEQLRLEEPVAVDTDTREQADEEVETVGDIDTDEDVEAEDADADAPAGPRRAALEERKKKKRVLQGAVASLAVLAALAGVVGAGFLVKEAVEDPQQRAAVPFDRPEEEELGGTTLIFGTKEKADPSRGAMWMVLLSLDPETEEAAIVYIPAHTAVEVPGRGLQGVGEAYGSGGVPLLLVSAENLLGIKIDRYLELSDKDALVLFEQLETLTVDVPAEVRVPAGRDQARLIFVDGPQQMTPESLVRLLYTMGIDGDDVELGSRHLAFWDQLLDVYDDPAELAAAFRDAGAALAESDVSTRELAAFVGSLTGIPSEDLTLTALPVRPISAGDAQLYSVDAEELTAFVQETIGTAEGAPQEVRVQLLNGNGVPGIGREAAAKLVGEGFRVILGGNARRLDYRRTLVIAYDSSEQGIRLAERARELLGVGEVQVSAQEQGIVDLTIVVGKDFLRAR